MSTANDGAGEWTTLSAMFNKKEMIPIRAVQKLYGWNNSQLVKQSIMVGTLFLLEERILNTPRTGLTQMMKIAVDTIFDKRTIKRIEKELEKQKASIDPAIMKQAEEEFQLLGASMNAFKEHRKRGRPSAQHRGRGRPKDIGIKG